MLSYLKRNYLNLILLLSALLGVIASFSYTIEVLNYYKDPNHISFCSLNLFVNCITTINSSYSNIMGFPNSMIGLVLFSILTGYIVTKLFTNFELIILDKIKFVFSIFGLLFTIYLMSISVFVLGALCPICMTSGLASTNIFMISLIDIGILKKHAAYVLIIGNILLILLYCLSYLKLST